MAAESRRDSAPSNGYQGVDLTHHNMNQSVDRHVLCTFQLRKALQRVGYRSRAQGPCHAGTCKEDARIR